MHKNIEIDMNLRDKVNKIMTYTSVSDTEKIDRLRDDYKLGEETIETPDGLTDETPILKSATYELLYKPNVSINIIIKDR